MVATSNLPFHQFILMLLAVIPLKQQIWSNYFPAGKCWMGSYCLQNKVQILQGPPHSDSWLHFWHSFFNSSPQITPSSRNERLVFPENPTEFPNPTFLLCSSLSTWNTQPFSIFCISPFLLHWSIYSFKSNYSNDPAMPSSAWNYPYICNRPALPSRSSRVVKPDG